MCFFFFFFSKKIKKSRLGLAKSIFLTVTWRKETASLPSATESNYKKVAVAVLGVEKVMTTHKLGTTVDLDLFVFYVFFERVELQAKAPDVGFTKCFCFVPSRILFMWGILSKKAPQMVMLFMIFRTGIWVNSTRPNRAARITSPAAGSIVWESHDQYDQLYIQVFSSQYWVIKFVEIEHVPTKYQNW